jgi:hypothetical protein
MNFTQLESAYSPFEQTPLHEAKAIIDSYFSTLVFTKVDIVDTATDAMMIYVAKIAAATMSKGSRYVILTVPFGPYGERVRVTSVPWTSLQTRVQEGSKYGKIPAQAWKVPNGVTDVHYSFIERTMGYTKYRPSVYNHGRSNVPTSLARWVNPTFPYEVMLLHNPKKKTMYQHHNHLTLMVAIETFECVITPIY